MTIFILFLFFAYRNGKRDLLSPWFLLCLAVSASFFIVLLNYRNWEVQINLKFILYVSSALLAWGVGSTAVCLLRPKTIENASYCEIRLPIKLSPIKKRYPQNILLVISVGLVVLYSWRMLSSVSGVPGLTAKLRQIYENIVNNGYSPGFIFNQALEIVVAIAYVNTFRLFQRIFSGKDGVSIIKIVIPILMLFIVVLVSTDRNIFLRYAFYAICLFVLFFRENYKKKNANAKIVQVVVVLLLIMMLIFFIMGKMKQYQSNILKSLGIYGGSGLYDFNLWIEEFDGELMYGASTFSTFLNSLSTILKPLGITLNFPQVDKFDPFIEFVAPNGYIYSSNIYTALKPYVEDFGYFGVILFPCIMGAFYQWLYLKVKNSKYGYAWIIYCMLIYPIIYFIIGEQLFRRFHLGFLYELFWISIVFFSAYGMKKIKIGIKRQVQKQTDKKPCEVADEKR
ncbi:MAG: oligosaccharide repeat unit polymerase [Clostridia bacterium]|nr:oligosaccharide repeat unit polymerase [Clostridia bacterium]